MKEKFSILLMAWAAFLMPYGALAQSSEAPATEQGASEESAADLEPEDLHRIAYANYQRGLHLIAFNQTNQAADAGLPKAKVLLAILYIEGLATGRDTQKARGLLEEAAAKGETEAYFLLGNYASRGTFSKVKADKALEYFTRASQQGHVRGRLQLALLLIDKPGDSDHAKKAAALLASILFEPEAAYQLGLLYLDGTGVPLDLGRGAKLVELAAKNGNETAQIHLASMFREGQNVKANEGQAIKWLKLAALKGNPLAQNQLARAYATGSGDNFNARAAAKWHLISRSFGMTDLWLDSFVAALPKELYADVLVEVRGFGY